jgi:DsbC/DsbD-like thiol-disulfide interchange protein
MKSINLRRFAQFLLITSVFSFPATFAAIPSPQSAPNIGVSGSLSGDKVQRGRPAQVVVVMDIPAGFHVQSSRPLEKFLISTQLQIEVPKGVRVGPVVYPRALMRNLKFSKSKVAVYEGRTTMRFNVTVPANFGSDSTEVKARLRYQSCNDEVCFPPQTREVKIPITIKG